MSHFFVCSLSRSNTRNCKLHVEQSREMSSRSARWSLRERKWAYIWNLPGSHIISSCSLAGTHSTHLYTWAGRISGSERYTEQYFYVFSWGGDRDPRPQVWEPTAAFSSVNKKINWIFGLLRLLSERASELHSWELNVE